MKKHYLLSSILAFALLLGGCKSSKVEKTIEQDLVDKSIEAQGGLEALKAIQSLKLTGSVSLMGMDMGIIMYQKRPNKLRMEVDVSAMGVEIVNGYDGETGWSINPMVGSGAQTVSGEEARGLALQADMDGLLVGYEVKGISIEYIGEEEVRGTTANKLKLVMADSTEMFMYLDAESNLIIKQENEGTNPTTGGKVTQHSYMKDYRDVNGVLMPYGLEVVFGEGELTQDITFTTIEVNVDIDDSLFVKPE